MQGGFGESCNLIAHLMMTVAFYTYFLSIFYLEYVPTTHDWSWENDSVNQRPSVTYNKHAAGFGESCNLIAHLRMTVAFYTCSLSIFFLEYVPTTQLIFRKWFVKLKIISYIIKKTCRGCLGESCNLIAHLMMTVYYTHALYPTGVLGSVLLRDKQSLQQCLESASSLVFLFAKHHQKSVNQWIVKHLLSKESSDQTMHLDLSATANMHPPVHCAG